MANAEPKVEKTPRELWLERMEQHARRARDIGSAWGGLVIIETVPYRWFDPLEVQRQQDEADHWFGVMRDIRSIVRTGDDREVLQRRMQRHIDYLMRVANGFEEARETTYKDKSSRDECARVAKAARQESDDICQPVLPEPSEPTP